MNQRQRTMYAQMNLYAREAIMNRHQIFDSFHNQLENADTQEIECLHDLCDDGSFRREAGTEFILAVDAVAEERGVIHRS
jgi:hypothetical protein